MTEAQELSLSAIADDLQSLADRALNRCVYWRWEVLHGEIAKSYHFNDKSSITIALCFWQIKP